MKRAFIYFITDSVLFLCMLGLILTGLLMGFVLPPRSGNLAVWGNNRHDWGDVHFYLALTLLGMLLVHLLLNWGWVCNVASKVLRRKTVPSRFSRNLTGAIVAALLALGVSSFLWAANKSVMPQRGFQNRQEVQADIAAPGGPLGRGRGGPGQHRHWQE